MNKKQNSLMRFSRTERLAQLSEQEIVIERKKREIQAKIEAQKKKETEEALKKLESTKESKSNKIGFSKKSWSGSEYQKNKNNEKPVELVKETLTNAFSNDGSFLDQFKKLSKSGLSSDNVDIPTLAMAKKREEFKKCLESDKKNFQNRTTKSEKHDAYRNLDKSFKSDQAAINDNNQLLPDRQPSDSKLKLQFPPPALVELVPQQQGVSVMTSISNPHSLVPHSVQISQFQAAQNQTSLFNENNFQLKSHPSTYSGSTKPVPHSQLSGTCTVSESKNQDTPVISDINSQSFPTTSLACIQPPLPITPQSIPPPSPIQIQNIPAPMKPPRDSELPKYRTESISLSLKPTVTKKLEAIPNPLEIDQPPSPETPSVSFPEKREPVNNSQDSSPATISQNFSTGDKECLRISSAFCDDDEDEDFEQLSEKCRHWAQLVARCGDEFEDSLRDRNQNDPDIRFLFEKSSKEYLLYRKLVLKYRKHHSFCERESSERALQKSHEDSSKDKIFSNNGNSDSDSCDARDIFTPERLGSNESKETSIHSNQNVDEGNCYKISDFASTKYRCQTDGEGSHKETFNENSKEAEMEITDQSKTEERRKRKRKSRWGDVVTTSAPGVAGNLSVQPPGQLPAPKSTLLSQLTRNDPGLIQYARQTFGSTNLSEEDWKKAEDHYKINLLYQDMVKKRAEVEKLERQGKFKYEYDSDEDTEGGTWEHKLRQQEMQATQLWAEELTRQAAGKHHIGDFLPPEELERFMEKYNAVKEGREPDLSDYKEYKLKQDNVGYRLLQKMGWNEGQGLGQDGSGIQNPVNKATTRHENQGLGVERPDGLEAGDDEYDAYRKRMMLAYRFRPNPLNNPRRPYY